MTEAVEQPRNAPVSGEPGVVIVRGDGAGFAQEIDAGRHRLRADESLAGGGTDTGPSPYDYLLVALGTCKSMTIALYAQRKHWPLEGVTIRLRHSKIYASDCADCDTKEGKLDRIVCEIELLGKLGAEERAQLIEIAQKCPVHRTLKSDVDIQTRVAGNPR